MVGGTGQSTNAPASGGTQTGPGPIGVTATLGVGGEGTSKLLCRVQSRLHADSTRMARAGTLGSGSGGGGYWGGNGGQVNDYYGGGGGGSSLIPADAAVTSSFTRDPHLIQFTYDACGILAQVSSMRARSKRYFSLFALRSIRLGLTTNGTFPSAATWCWFNGVRRGSSRVRFHRELTKFALRLSLPKSVR